jgi:hypothetical protein
MAMLAKHFGTSDTFLTHTELVKLRQTECSRYCALAAQRTSAVAEPKGFAGGS